MRKKDIQSATVLCANRVGDDIVRVAVQVKRGREVERVVILDVNRTVTEMGAHGRRKSDAEVFEAAKLKAMHTSFMVAGTRILMASYNGIALTETKRPFTGVGQPDEAEARS